MRKRAPWVSCAVAFVRCWVRPCRGSAFWLDEIRERKEGLTQAKRRYCIA